MHRVPRWLLNIAPLIFFAALLLARAHRPASLVFDEIHYIPAAKALASLTEDLNWVHPPLGKLIMAVGYLLLSKWTGLIGEPMVFRVIAILFGLWALWGVRGWMRALGYSNFVAQAAVWLTGFNFLWFVQSKTAMLDIFFLAFSIWGLLDVYQATRQRTFEQTRPVRKFWRGWLFLGFAMACKWSALPYVLVALIFSRRRLDYAFFGGVFAIFCYAITFFPLTLIEKVQMPLSGIIEYHLKMLRGLESINSANHPYTSKWWKWPTMIRPMWYTFESNGTRDVCIWAGINPILAWVGLPTSLYMAWAAFRERNVAARALTMLYWFPLLFWAVVPRKLQMFYYYLPAAMWLGPAVVWAHERFYRSSDDVRRTRGWLLFGFVLLCAAIFIYFLPIMDARDLPAGRYRHYMWLRSWI